MGGLRAQRGSPQEGRTPSDQSRVSFQRMANTPESVSDGITYRWRGPIADAEMVALVDSHGGRSAAGWWNQIRPHSLGWVSARSLDGTLVGFVNVATDGGDHAFLIDTKTHGEYQRKGIGTRLVQIAAAHAETAGCEWLHVDFEPELAPFYFEACGFRPTDAGLIHLRSPSPT